jgi:hypothetical protein
MILTEHALVGLHCAIKRLHRIWVLQPAGADNQLPRLPGHIGRQASMTQMLTFLPEQQQLPPIAGHSNV